MSRILVVDDDETVGSIVAEFLTREGYDCTRADSVAKACAYLEKDEFELAISDFNMPCETGLDLLKHVVSSSPSTYFILMSGNMDADLRKKASSLGALACMAKPFKLQELLKKVRDVPQRALPSRRQAKAG